MKFYAQLNENNICIGISQLSGEVLRDDMIEISSFDNSFLWKKYENETWSTETYEPQTTAPLTEFEQLKVENENLKQQLQATQQAVDFLLMGGM